MEANRITTCPNCGKKFVGETEVCPFCKQPLNKNKPEAPRIPIAVPEEQPEVIEKPARSRRGFGQSLTLKLIASVCIVLMALLAVVSGSTGAFKEDKSDKTVLFTTLEKDYRTSFSQFINQFSPLFESGYNYQKNNFDDMLAVLSPDCEGGLYQSFGNSSTSRTGNDPAERFDSNTAYVVMKEKEISAIAKSMNLTALKDVNTPDSYYYDGNYYFTIDEESNVQKLYAVLDSSKQTNSGDYYCVINVYDNANALTDDSDLTPLYQRYVLVSLDIDDDGDLSWKLKNISADPLYTKTGARAEVSTPEGTLQYKLKRKTMVAKTESGKVFAKYYIEYPVFTDSGIAQTACESVYSDQIEEFKTKIGNVDTYYKAFKSDGGKDSMLPLYTNVTVSVEYNQDGYFSIVEKVTDYNPMKKYEVTTTTRTTGTTSYYSYYTTTTESTTPEIDETIVELPVSTYESCTFNIETGEFVKKDDLLGTDYSSISDKLKEIYQSSYGVTATPITTSTTAIANSSDGYYTNTYSDTESETEDENVGIGSDIYNSAWTLSAEGMNFFYVTEENGTSVVTLPMSEIDSSFMQSDSETAETSTEVAE